MKHTEVAELLAALRQRGPLVQCITNSVVTGFTANALLALGAAPAMVDNREEATVFAGVADALLTVARSRRRRSDPAAAARTLLAAGVC